VKGEKIRTLTQGYLEAGSRTLVWDGLDDAGRPVGSGLYFYRLETADFRATRKMVLMK
jgi:hypothetical protein